jgi:hypothetical protein
MWAVLWAVNLLKHNGCCLLQKIPLLPCRLQQDVSTRLPSTTTHCTTVIVIAQWPFTCIRSLPQLTKQLILQTCEQTLHSVLSLSTASLTDFLMVVLSPSRRMSRKYLERIQVFWTWCYVGCILPLSSRVKHSWTMILWDFQNHLPTTWHYIPQDPNLSSIADRITSTSCTIL